MHKGDGCRDEQHTEPLFRQHFRKQISILPKTFPAFLDRKEFGLYARMIPARKIGGNLDDFFLIDKSRVGVIIGDDHARGDVRGEPDSGGFAGPRYGAPRRADGERDQGGQAFAGAQELSDDMTCLALRCFCK